MAQSGINLERLAKVWALVEGGKEGEADAARTRAAAMIEPYGYVLDDIPGLLADAGFGDDLPQPEAGGFTVYNMSNPAHVRAWQREHDATRRRWMRDNADRIAEVIARYGSKEAVFAPTAEEKALDAAIEPFREVHPDNQADTFDGENFRPSPRVVEAMGQAIPWPDTIPAALAEYEAWDRLCDDRNVADGNNQYDYLSNGADKRRWHLCDMVEKLIPARDLSDVIVRLRFQLDGQGSRDSPQAVLDDLERLQAAGGGASETRESPGLSLDADTPGNEGDKVGNPHVWAGPNLDTPPPFKLNTAGKRRAEVERILATPEGKHMPLREIAAIVGVSPSTVLNIRRRMAT
ncbi:helix-turn-helix domain-containing protein [Novacetimonas hansenii]|uniref:helix-turn-helix domain-containing protein n=1 Tax=Novacetimonas hansenii TaxID=436 RepID=UPI00248E27F7|nr:helix-turn-helix domain-containing protein [Novacetimonas hansenii]